jgi:hypothetical protein
MKLKQHAAVLSVALALAASVSATPVLQITDGVAAPITVTDNLAGDANPLAGAVSFNGVINGWNILVSSGVTKPIIGSSTSPALDLTWQVTRSSAAGGASLTICFSENGFNLATPRTFVTDVGGTAGPAGNTVNVRTYYDLGNTTLAQTTLLTSHLFTSPPNGFSASDVGGPVPADPSVAFTIKLVLSQAVGTVSSGDIDLHTVPEGGSMVTFLGTALLALGVFAVRRKSLRA